MLNRALHQVVVPRNSDVAGYSGFDWTFGLKKSKKEKAKEKAKKEEKRENQRFTNAIKRAEADIEARQVVIQDRQSADKKKNMTTVAILAVVTALALGGGAFAAYKLHKKKKR